jgi:hypothetical protein
MAMLRRSFRRAGMKDPIAASGAGGKTVDYSVQTRCSSRKF